MAQSVPKETEHFYYKENLAFLYCPADTDLSVSFMEYVDPEELTVQINVGREIVCYDSGMRDVVTVGGGLEYSDVDSISYENHNGSATITVKLKNPPSALISYVYVNTGKSNDLQCCIDDWGTIVCPPYTAVIDNTVYRRMAMEETVGLKSAGAGIRYIPVGELRAAVKERILLSAVSGGIVYTQARDLEYEYGPEIITMAAQNHGIVYTQTGTSPI